MPLRHGGQRFLCADLEGVQLLRGGDTLLPEEGKLLPVPFKLHDLLFQMGRHPGRVLSLFHLAQQVEIVDIQGQKALVLGMSPVGAVGRAVYDSGLDTFRNGVQVALNGRPDAVLRDCLLYTSRCV